MAVGENGTILQSDPLSEGDLTPPAFSSGYPKAGTVSSSSAQIKVKVNENGKAYFICLPSGAAAPSSAQVKAGQDSTGTSVAANLKSSLTLTAGKETSCSVTGLQSNTDYDIYVVAEDSVLNLKAFPVKVTVKTAEAQEQKYKKLSVSPSKLSIKVGQTKKLKVTAKPVKGKNVLVTNDADYDSSDFNIVTVDKGVVKAVGKGDAVIIIKYGGLEKSIKVMVK